MGRGPLRARLGYDTGILEQFPAGLRFRQIWSGRRRHLQQHPQRQDRLSHRRRSGDDGAQSPDPMTYASDFDTKFTIGRQRL
jgi:hypothetical protein